MKNKRKILLVSGIGIVIMAIAIGVTIAVSRPGTMKNRRQAASGQTTESKEKDNELPVLPIGTDTPQSGDDTSTTQSDSGMHGKKASREQVESKGKKNDSKSPDQKNTTGADSKSKADKKPSHSENQEPSDSKADTTKQEDQSENPDRDQSVDNGGKEPDTKSDQKSSNSKDSDTKSNQTSDNSKDSGTKSNQTSDKDKNSNTKSDQITDNKKPGNQTDDRSDKTDTDKKDSDTIELPFIPAK